MDRGQAYPTITSTAFVAAMKNVSFTGLSGDVSFDINGDRVGYVFVSTKNPRSNFIIYIYIYIMYTFFTGRTSFVYRIVYLFTDLFAHLY
jgi:hypothetical protein